MTHKIHTTLWSACFFLCAFTASAADRPNIVLFLVDDMGLMDTSVPMLTDQTGKPKRHPWNDWYRTPSMERLAAKNPKQLRSMIQGMVRELESMDAVYPVKDGQTLEPVVPQEKKS